MQQVLMTVAGILFLYNGSFNPLTTYQLFGLNQCNPSVPQLSNV